MVEYPIRNRLSKLTVVFGSQPHWPCPADGDTGTVKEQSAPNTLQIQL